MFNDAGENIQNVHLKRILGGLSPFWSDKRGSGAKTGEERGSTGNWIQFRIVLDNCTHSKSGGAKSTSPIWVSDHST